MILQICLYVCCFFVSVCNKLYQASDISGRLQKGTFKQNLYNKHTLSFKGNNYD